MQKQLFAECAMPASKLTGFFILLLLALLSFPAAAQTSPAIEWQRCLGGSGYDYAYNIAPTTDGGYLLAGYSNSIDSQVTGNHGNYDAWIVKLGAGGNMIWQKSFGGSGVDQAFDIMQTSDGNYFFTGLSGSDDGDLTGNNGLLDFWVVKMDTNQQIIWQKNYGGSESERAIAAQQTFDGGYAVIGFTFSSDKDVTGHHDSSDFWLLRLDSKGDLLWQKCLGGTGPDWGSSVRQLPDGGYILSGRCGSNDGDITGNHGSDDVWIVRLDSSANIIWEKSFGGSDREDYAYAIPTDDGGFIVGAITRSIDGDVTDINGYDDYWIFRLNSNGDLLWQKTYGGCCDDDDYYIAETADHGYVLAGHVFSGDQDITDYNGASDVWVIKIDSLGNLLWEKAMGGDDLDGARSLEVTEDGGYIVMGSATSNNGDVSGNHGDVDYWAIKLSCDAPSTYFADADSDGYGNPAAYEIKCGPPSVGYITDSTDCNDSNPQVNPGVVEVCNELDDNCDGVIDEGVQSIFYADSDGDGYGNATMILYACTMPFGYTTDSTDCDDTNPEVNTGAMEVCNEIDDDCNGSIDEGVESTFYADSDGDGYGNASAILLACTMPLGYTVDSTDCDDTNPDVHPGATEIQNGIDDDCNGMTDEFGVAIEEASQQIASMDLFPDPANDNFITVCIYGVKGETQLILYNAFGERILSNVQMISAGQNCFALNLAGFNNGVYFLMIENDSKTLRKQFVINK